LSDPVRLLGYPVGYIVGYIDGDDHPLYRAAVDGETVVVDV